ncbi:MAG: hypothetical protein ACRD4I_15240, partial [Candidatus Angelobacter sp.]
MSVPLHMAASAQPSPLGQAGQKPRGDHVQLPDAPEGERATTDCSRQLLRWAYRRHPTKGARWVYAKCWR